MESFLKYNKLIIIIYMVVIISFSVFFNCYTIAASNYINVSGPSSIEEGQTITFNITFSDNVNDIWLSDGDIIKKGFSGTVKVNKISDRNYTVIISNISNVGTGKCIIINSGVGYIDNVPTDSVSSNVFEIATKQVVDNIDENVDNNGNTDNNNENGNSNINTKPGNGDIGNVQNPNIDNSTGINTNQPIIDNTEEKEEIVTEIEEIKIKREIPNTGKLI